MIHILECFCIIVLWIGIYISNSHGIKDKKRQIGWLITSYATFADGLLILIDGQIILAIIILALSIVDFKIYNYCRKEYNKLKMDNKEKFLRDIMNHKKK